MLNKFLMLLGFIFTTLLYVPSLEASSIDVLRGAVYVATNNATANEIVIYNRAEDGTLSMGGRVATGGGGSGPGELFSEDPLGSQGSLIISGDKHFLFAVNAGSNEISSFQIKRSGLTLVSKVASGGQYPVSLTEHDGLLYVLNAAGNANVSGFRVASNGTLTPLSGSTRIVGTFPFLPSPPFPGLQPSILATPGQVGFDPKGRFLVVVIKEAPIGAGGGPGRFEVFKMDEDLPSAVSTTSVSNGLWPFAFTFGKNDALIVVEVGAQNLSDLGMGLSTVSSYKIEKNGSLSVISPSVGSGQEVVCWIVRAGRFAYTSNNFSDTISKYEVDGNGALSLADPKAAILGPGLAAVSTFGLAFPLDIGATDDGRFLYQLTVGTGGLLSPSSLVHLFRIERPSGDLTPLGTIGGIPPLSGAAGLTVVDFNRDHDDE